MNLAQDYLEGSDLADAPRSVQEFRPAGSVLLTPRFRHSRYVVTLLYDATGTPRVVAKTARVPGDRGTLGDEFSVLRAVAARAGAGTAPYPIAFANHRGHWMLVQTAMQGEPLGGGGAGAYPQHAWGLVDAWLLRLARATAKDAPGGWFDDQTATDIRAVARVLPGRGGRPVAAAELAEVTERFARQLDDVRLPRPIEHGDLAPTNVLMRGRNEVSVIDWELGRTHGLPGADAALFLACLVFAQDGARTDDAKVASYRRHFLHADGTGRARLAAHLKVQGVEAAWIDQILLATWVRYTLAAFGRALPDLAVGDTRDAVVAEVPPGAWWGSALWLATVEHLAGVPARGAA